MTPVAGAVLAGGASRRMGRTKALVAVDGVPMAARVAAALAGGGCTPIVVIGGEPAELRVLGVPLVADRHPGAGPLGGVITALHVAPDVVVAACDLADLDAATVRAVLDAPVVDTTAAVVAVGDRLEPALARWRAPALATLEEMFAAGDRALQAGVRAVEHVEVRVDPAALRNVNTPADVHRRRPARRRSG